MSADITPEKGQSKSVGTGDGSALRIDDPRVLDAVAGVNRRSLELALAISAEIAAAGYQCTPQMEIEIGNRISNHIIGAEWPEAVKFAATSLPNIKISNAGTKKE